MATKPTPTKAKEPKASPAAQAFGAAHAFIEHLAMIAQDAREYQSRADKPDAWKAVAWDYADAFIAWYDLSFLLTLAVRTEARRVYPAGAAAIRLGAAPVAPVVPAMPEAVVQLLMAFRRVELTATPYLTVIEAVAYELGGYFRNAVYWDRRHPLEPVTVTETRPTVWARLGIKTYGDGQDLMMNEWKAQDLASGESALSLLRCGSIDFADLLIQLEREAEAVIAAAVAAAEKIANPIGSGARTRSPKEKLKERYGQIGTASLEQNFNVAATVKALQAKGMKVKRSTVYNCWTKLDRESPGWRANVQPSNTTESLDGFREVGKHRKSWGQVR